MERGRVEVQRPGHALDQGKARPASAHISPHSPLCTHFRSCGGPTLPTLVRRASLVISQGFPWLFPVVCRKPVASALLSAILLLPHLFSLFPLSPPYRTVATSLLLRIFVVATTQKSV